MDNLIIFDCKLTGKGYNEFLLLYFKLEQRTPTRTSFTESRSKMPPLSVVVTRNYYQTVLFIQTRFKDIR